jgi:serine/threonine protein kinase/pSer/pThr/pTyr-binding forkhead associated (FHA) protein
MQATITVTVGPSSGQEFTLRPGQRVTVGRGSEAELRIEDPCLSRRHAHLELRQDGLYVTDLGSVNGTALAGAALEPNVARLVEDQHEIVFGEEVRVRVGVDGARLPRGGHERRELEADQALLDPAELELSAKIGHSMSSRVWAAHHKPLDRIVAVKLLLPNRELQTEKVRARMVREAQLACRVKSTFVVEVHDFRLLEGDTPCIVMELVNGPSLDERLMAGPLQEEEALRIAADLARALEELGRHGVVHRDIRPGNVLIAEDGTAKLSDFGVAKDLSGGLDLTQTGVKLGSLPYTAPEQALDPRKVDPRTDVYGLGATLYHLLAGRPPFPSVASSPRKAQEAVERVIHEPPAPLDLARPDCSAEVVQLVHSMLEKAPQDRPQSPRAVAETVFRLLGEELPPPDDPPGDHMASLDISIEPTGVPFSTIVSLLGELEEEDFLEACQYPFLLQVPVAGDSPQAKAAPTTPTAPDATLVVSSEEIMAMKRARAADVVLHAFTPRDGGDAGKLSIGRGKDCDLVLPEGSVSKRHAEVTHTLGRWLLSDLGSANGTFVNAKPVKGEEAVTLEDRQTLHFSSYRAVFLQPEALFLLVSRLKK